MGEKKPAHWERVNPSFGRVEETGATIDNRRPERKFLFSIAGIWLMNDAAGEFSLQMREYFSRLRILSLNRKTGG
jgi:hypothetical protein